LTIFYNNCFLLSDLDRSSVCHWNPRRRPFLLPYAAAFPPVQGLLLEVSSFLSSHLPRSFGSSIFSSSVLFKRVCTPDEDPLLFISFSSSVLSQYSLGWPSFLLRSMVPPFIHPNGPYDFHPVAVVLFLLPRDSRGFLNSFFGFF